MTRYLQTGPASVRKVALFVGVTDCRAKKTGRTEVNGRVGLQWRISGAMIAEHTTSPQVRDGRSKNDVVHKEYREVGGVHLWTSIY